MKIDVNTGVTLKEIEAALQQAFTGSDVKIKQEKDQIVVSVNSFQGAMIRLFKACNTTKMEVTPHMPVSGPLEIVSSIAAFLIYQSFGRLYGIIAIIIAVGWPILLGQFTSASIVSECVTILSKPLPAGKQMEPMEIPKKVPEPTAKKCPKCGNTIRFGNDLYCRKCGEKIN